MPSHATLYNDTDLRFVDYRALVELRQLHRTRSATDEASPTGTLEGGNFRPADDGLNADWDLVLDPDE